MNKIRIIFFFFLCSAILTAQQTDYLEIREAVKITTCEITDSSSVYSTIRNLLAVDTMALAKNIHLYYEDLGKSYWLLSTGEKDSPYLIQAIGAMHKSLFHQPLSTNAFWNLSFFYSFSGDCAKSQYYMEQYKLNTKKKYWQPDQEEMLLKRCRKGV